MCIKRLDLHGWLLVYLEIMSNKTQTTILSSKQLSFPFIGRYLKRFDLAFIKCYKVEGKKYLSLYRNKGNHGASEIDLSLFIVTKYQNI